MPEVSSGDAVLHVAVDGAGDPVTVFAHGLTNSCMELAAFTPFAPGTKIRFCFRGHGHSTTPETGHFRFADFARDLEAVASAYGATNAVGTSLGAGALTHLLGGRPDRFDRLVFLFPAALDVVDHDHSGFDHTADLLETLPREEAIRAVFEESGRAASYEANPGLRDFDMLLWQDMNPIGVARAIREIVHDVAIDDREKLRAVRAPALVIAREGDPIHPAELGRVLVDLMPNAELIMLESEGDLLAQIPVLLQRVATFLGGGG